MFYWNLIFRNWLVQLFINIKLLWNFEILVKSCKQFTYPLMRCPLGTLYSSLTAWSRRSPDRHDSARRSPDRHESARRSPDRHESARRSPERHESARRSPDRHESARRSPDRHESARRSPDRHESARRSPDRYDTARNDDNSNNGPLADNDR